MRKRAALHNLGCKVNAYELDEIAGSLAGRGYEIVPFSEEADIYIVNTCTVTNIADRKSRQMLHRARKRNPGALVVALGCYVDTDPAGVEKDPCIDVALGNRDKAGLAEVLALFEGRDDRPAGKTVIRCQESGLTPDGRNRSGRQAAGHPGGKAVPQDHYSSRTRAYLKIQDGCNLFCSYCIIPYARGRSVSRHPEEILREAEAIAAQGVKEIVLTGIHISSYGLDFKNRRTRESGADRLPAPEQGDTLAALVLAINEMSGIERIRLGSLEPRMVTPEVVRTIRQAEKLCPHFHLSLQSGSDSVLKRMRRRYTTEEYTGSVLMLREAFDNPAITTDVIVGFPGETVEEFEESRAFIERTNFYETHIFPFSMRRGTVAAQMEGQLTQKEKAARVEVLLKLNGNRSKAYRTGFLNRPLRVLWEETEVIGGKTYLTGHTEHYVRTALPVGENDVPPAVPEKGTVTTVLADGFLTDEILTGHMVQ